MCLQLVTSAEHDQRTQQEASWRSSPLTQLWKHSTASLRVRKAFLVRWPFMWRWMHVAAAAMVSARSLSSTAIWPARRNTWRGQQAGAGVGVWRVASRC